MFYSISRLLNEIHNKVRLYSTSSLRSAVRGFYSQEKTMKSSTKNYIKLSKSACPPLACRPCTPLSSDIGATVPLDPPRWRHTVYELSDSTISRNLRLKLANSGIIGARPPRSSTPCYPTGFTVTSIKQDRNATTFL